MKKFLLFIGFVVFLVVLLFVMFSMKYGWTDAERKQVLVTGSSAKVVCYSGDREIYNGASTGKVQTEQGSDGWFFEDKITHELIRVSGACLIRN
jgi:hypothetical protein